MSGNVFRLTTPIMNRRNQELLWLWVEYPHTIEYLASELQDGNVVQLYRLETKLSKDEVGPCVEIIGRTVYLLGRAGVANIEPPAAGKRFIELGG